MKIGIVGLPQCGKKTLFQLLTGVEAQLEAQEIKPIPGTANIRDIRFDFLAELYDPRRRVPAQIIVELLPDLDSRVMKESDIFKDAASLDALCHIVRSFQDDTIYHVSGSVDPERDMEVIDGEFILHDLIFIEKRMERIVRGVKQGMKDQQKKEESVMIMFKEHLESDLPLRVLDIPQDIKKLTASYPFITSKEMVVALNTSDNMLHKMELLHRIQEKYSGHGINMMQISAKLEGEIAQLESDEEKKDFMEASGIEEPAINQLSRLCMDALGLISFFTVGKDEVRQWLVKKSSYAPEAAGAVHSDIERGFIRAEVIKYDDLFRLGSEDKVKQAGKLHVMGRDYQIEDGDIINFRFNV